MYSPARDTSMPRWFILDCKQFIIQIEKIIYNEELPTVDPDALLSRSFDCLRNRQEFENELIDLTFQITYGDFAMSKIDPFFASNVEVDLGSLALKVCEMLHHIKNNLERNRYYVNDYFNYEYRSRDQNGYIYFECV